MNKIIKRAVIGVRFKGCDFTSYYDKDCNYFDPNSKQWVETGWSIKELKKEKVVFLRRVL